MRLFLTAFLVFWLPKLAESLYTRQSAGYYALCALFAAALSLALAWARDALRWKWPDRAALALGLALGIFNLGHLLIFGRKPTAGVFIAAFETYQTEAFQFISMYLTAPVALGLAAYAAASFLIPALMDRNRLFRRIKSARALAGLASLAVLANMNWGTYSTFDPLRHYWIYRRQQKEFINGFKSFDSAPAPKVSISPLESHVAVLVIGESTTRNKMSLYGYLRPTNPKLARRAGEMLKFDNALTPHSHTVPALTKVLTLLNHENEHTLSRNMNLLQLAKLAGYKTYWISNQPPDAGYIDLMVTVIAEYADEKFWLNAGSFWKGGRGYDNVVFKPFRDVLREKNAKKLIVVHLLGTHGKYELRYPPEFNRFRDNPPTPLKLKPREKRVYNSYDNAVLYNDAILETLISELSASRAKDQTLVYLSDHGEEVYDFRKFFGHTETIQSNAMFEIPFFIWTNPAHDLRRRWSAAAKNNLRKLYGVEDLIHTMHDVLGIRTEHYDPSRSVLSSAFREKKVAVGSQWYEKGSKTVLQYAATKNDISFKNKIMVHRVDSLERYRELIKRGYGGFEVDVVFDAEKNFFDVRHPPVPSIGLSFESYLKEKSSGNFNFWLDVKNLSAANAAEFLRHLKALDARYRIRERVIVESPEPGPLSVIASAGFYTSLYLPPADDVIENWAQVQYAVEAARLMKTRFSAVSQWVSALPVLEAFFSDCDKLVWIIPDDQQHAAQLKELLDNKRVKVVLVGVDSAGIR